VEYRAQVFWTLSVGAHNAFILGKFGRVPTIGITSIKFRKPIELITLLRCLTTKILPTS